MAIVIVGLVGIDIIQYLNPGDIFDTVRNITSSAGENSDGVQTLE